jgi:hypothetical protein
LLAAVAGQCIDPAAPLAFHLCGADVSDGAKVIAVHTQADVERGAYAVRGQTRGYRVYELAGTAHVPATRSDVPAPGDPGQNPISLSPALRAAHDNLLRWIRGAAPPPSRYLALRDVAPVTNPDGTPHIPLAVDADGNALGGVRLPHMPALSRGVAEGGPLGAYGGLNRDAGSPFLSLGGTFAPFPAARLRQLYPTHADYVARVTRAADRLLERRFILKAGRDGYVRAARAAAVP